MVMVLLLVFDGQDKLAASLLADHTCVPPENILFLLGDPSPDKDIVGILSRHISRVGQLPSESNATRVDGTTHLVNDIVDVIGTQSLE